MTVTPSDLVHVEAGESNPRELSPEGLWPEDSGEGDRVKVSPLVVSVVGDVTSGKVMGGLVPMMTTPELDTTISLSDLVHVVALSCGGKLPLGGGAETCGGSVGGLNVNVCPSVVSVV